MLAPRASSAFVCLRCELTQARLRLPALPRRAPHASFSASSRRRRDASDEDLDSESRPNFQPRPHLSEHPLGIRLRKRKGGGHIRETTARLEGSKTLGEDASIIVLEELGERKKREAIPEPQIVHDDEHIPLKLAEALADERPATLEEVVEQLDKLRQKATNDDAIADEGHYVSQTVYFRLSNHLFKSFTGAQLSHYYSERKGVEKDRVPQEVRDRLKKLQGTAKRTSLRSEWTPGTSQIDRRLPSLDVHSKKKRKNIGKHLLVDQILRDVWKLIMLEELEATGEIELALKDWQLAMLTSGTETVLDRIGRNRKARLDVNTADKVLRITADKHTAEYAANDVEQLLLASESQRFHFNTWVPHLKTLNGAEPTIDSVFPGDVLATVTSLTGAQLQRATDQIIIRALDKETIAEAMRCLVKILPLKSTSLGTVDTTGRSTLESPDHFRPVVVEKESVEYKARNSKFGRWSLPMKQANVTYPTSASVARRVKTAQEHVLKMTLTPPTPNQRIKIKHQKWNHKTEIRLKAIYGHALLPLEDSSSEAAYFVPALPGLSSMFADQAFTTSFTTRPLLCYEFIAQPGPGNYTSDLLPYKFPKLMAYFRFIDGQQGLSKVILSFGAGNHQVLLPEEAVDVWFQTYQSIQMNNSRVALETRTLREHVLENLQSGGRLSAPDITLPIPKWTVGGMKFDEKDDLIKTKYQFVGVTFTQSVWGEHDGSPASYSTKQSGKLGAKHGVFSTIYGVNRMAKPIAINDPPNAIREFVANAFKTARTITKAAAASQAGLKKIGEKPKQRQSSDNFIQRGRDISHSVNDALSLDQPSAPSYTQILEDALSDPHFFGMLNDNASPADHHGTTTVYHPGEIHGRKTETPN
ncbi:hypothetical protein P171DRAFT_379938 [Karstenula rhodostoma CBS 690.94]|uniref:Mitochondrial inner-membrane-bound regulator-domain-containing protein n=1 Tax=Karstenula rhodostoma CBS 690.94 TaxID=1392251 RepID=A0A9P4UGN3_9PLEO|nr:hypothetical protein P171DRAFT_379938 [Karstenula rhodostoma CBS 690.94]